MLYHVKRRTISGKTQLSKGAFMNLKNFVVAAAGLALMAGCSSSTGPKDDISDQYNVYLTGFVLDQDGNPIANTVATVKGTALSDTTGADGRYLIVEDRHGSSRPAPSGDSVQYLKAGQVITMQNIPKWIDTLPDVFIEQRDIFGHFTASPVSLGRITAVITGDGIPAANPLVAARGYISLTQNYSGYVYFVYSGALRNYSVVINVYNSDSVLIGRSLRVDFASNVGDVQVPDFDPNNALPSVYAGDDTTVSINDTIRLHAVASDSFGGSIAKWEWSINGGSFNQTSSGDTIIFAPATESGNYVCAVRVTDNDGLIATDTMVVNVVLDPPVVFAGNDIVVAKNSQVTLHDSASQQFGSIVKWEWDINGTGFVQTSTGDTTITTPDSVIAVYPCVLRVTDDDGNTAEDTVNIQVGTPAPVQTSPDDGDTVISEFYFYWSGDSCASYYCLQVSNAPNFSSLVVNDTVFSNQFYADSSRFVWDTTAYYWRVRSYTSIGWSDWSDVWSFTTIWVASPSAPMITQQPIISPSSTVYVGDSVRFRLTATGNPSPNKYQWWKFSGGGPTLVDTTNTGSYKIDSVTSADSGNYFVVVSNSQGTVTSNIFTLTVLPIVPPALELVQPVGGESYTVGDTVQIQWKINDSTKITTVVVALSLDSGMTFTPLFGHSFSVDTTSALLVVDSTQVSNQAIIKVYDYQDPYCFDASGSFTILPVVPAAPVLVSPADGATGVSTTPTLTWNASTGVFSNYYVQISTVSDFSSSVSNTYVMPSDSSYTVGPALNASTTYYWHVMVNSIYGSSWSAVWSFTTGP